MLKKRHSLVKMMASFCYLERYRFYRIAFSVFAATKDIRDDVKFHKTTAKSNFLTNKRFYFNKA